MAGSGAYLTRFEDYYKSSDEEDEEDDVVSSPPVEQFGGVKYGEESEVGEDYVGSDEDEEDDRPDDGMVEDHRDSDWKPPEVRDWVPQSLVDLKLRIKAPPTTATRGGVEQLEKRTVDIDGEERAYSNDYQDVCKYRCKVCCQEVDSDRLKYHMSSNHEDLLAADIDVESEARQDYDVKSWHRCGICGEDVVFTRVKLRYHVITLHGVTIQEYNEKYMMMRSKRRGGGRKVVGGAMGIKNSPMGIKNSPMGIKNSPSSSSMISSDSTENDNLGDVDPADISEDQISNDYADIVRVQCRICEKSVEQDNFRFVHLKKHGLDLDDYRRSYGQPTLEKMVYHRCQICEQIFLFTRSRLSSHLVRHKISTKDYGTKFLTKVKTDKTCRLAVTSEEIDKDCMFSNDYEDECSTVCQLCERSLYFGNLGSHLYQSHGVKMKDFVEKYGEPQITKKSYHECAICHETLLFIRYHLNQHVKTKHGMSINAYNVAHMQLHNVEYSDSNPMEKGRKIGTQKAPQWCDGTMYKCPYCFNIYYRYFTFRIHLINSHQMMDSEERSTCVRENEILTDIYRCKICQVQMKRDRMDIEAHLKQAHKITIKIYAKNFENTDSVETATEAVERLVNEKVLEEPSQKLFRTPKKLKGGKKALPSPRPTIESRVPVNGVDHVRVPDTYQASRKPSPVNITPQKGSPVPKVKQEISLTSSELKQNTLVEEIADSFESVQRDCVEESLMNEKDIDLNSKRKRKLPSKFSEEFEVGISNPPKSSPQTNSQPAFIGSPKRQKVSEVNSVKSPSPAVIPSQLPSPKTVLTPKRLGPASKLEVPTSPLTQRSPNIKKERISPVKTSYLSRPSPVQSIPPVNPWSSPTLQPSPPNTLSPRAAKLSHSLVTVRQPSSRPSPVHQPRLSLGSGGGGVTSPGKEGRGVREEVIVKTEVKEEAVIYRCPLEGCEWTCGREGMRQGPAVLHLLRSHKIQPKEMRERGIKFDKILA